MLPNKKSNEKSYPDVNLMIYNNNYPEKYIYWYNNGKNVIGKQSTFWLYLRPTPEERTHVWSIN